MDILAQPKSRTPRQSAEQAAQVLNATVCYSPFHHIVHALS